MALRYALTFPWTPEAGREARQRISWLRAEAQHLAARIAASGPPATRGAKRIVTTRLLAGFGEARALPDTIRHAIEWSHDIDEGSAAHREGRPPRFTGR